jgi:hypothetical protein
VTTDLPGWAGSVSADTLTALLALQGERDWLDYKRQCDLSSARGLVELAKDIGAMMITGGYIVIGADDTGRPAGDVEHPELFDPASLHHKLARYLPEPLEIRSAVHRHQNQSYALVYAAPHPDGFCIFERDGAYPDGKGQATAFRAGEVFARHGTRSERWNQRDVAVIKRRLQAAADRYRDQETEALGLLQGIPPQLGGSGLWLALSVVPEYPAIDALHRSPDVAQEFLSKWHESQAPIEMLAQGTATYRQPGGVVITSQAAHRDRPQWWRLALHDAGQAAGAHVLAHDIARDPLSGDRQWYGLPELAYDPQTIPARRDKVECHLLALLDLLTAHAVDAGAGGRATIAVAFLAPPDHAWANVALVDELVDDGGQRQGWRPAGARAHQQADGVLLNVVTRNVGVADMRDASRRLRAAYGMAADLLAVFAIDQPSMLTADGSLDPYGAATDRQQTVYQHARHLGLPTDPESPIERRQKYEDAVRAAKEELRRR